MPLKLMLVCSSLLLSACVATTEKQTNVSETTPPTPTTAQGSKLTSASVPSKPDEVSGCRPDRKGSVEVIQVGPRMHTVGGELAGFNPCNRFVQFAIPANNTKPPVMILMHGAGGARDNSMKFELFRQMGMAVLSFDAYKMNNLQQGEMFWLSQASYEARQRMFYKIAKQAYDWVLSQSNVDTSQLYMYGISNGADVVLNLAAVVSPNHVRAVFAEGAAGAGLGLPNKLQVPVVMIFGKEDNYASVGNNNKRWLNQWPCRFNAPQGLYPDKNDPTPEPLPPGNAINCNALGGGNDLTQTTLDWSERQKASGADIKVWFYEGAAHGILTYSPLTRRSITSGGNVMGGNIGAEQSAKSILAEDIKAVIFSAGN